MPSTWLRVRVAGEDPEGLLGEALLACGGSAVQEDGGGLVTWLPGDAGVTPDQVRERLTAILGSEPAQFEAEEVPEQDWLALWRTGLEARRIGKRIVVSPTWCDVDERPGDLVIRIDPQMAFGTGEHASTRGVLRLMQQAVRPGERLLDVGAGSAILAIAGAMLGANRVLAVESDPEAMDNAHENISRNGVADRVSAECALVDEAWLGSSPDTPFDGILANVLSSVLLPLLRPFHDALVPGGWVILSGILAEEADTMRRAAVASGFAIAAEDSEEQWWSVLLRRSG